MSSNFWSGEFYFDNIHSSVYKVCIVDVNDTNKLKQHGLSVSESLTKETNVNGDSSYSYGQKDSENITLQFCKTDGSLWTASDIISLNGWLFKKNFKRFQTFDFFNNGYNIVYYLKAVNMKKYITPQMDGYIEFEFQSFDSYAYILPNNNFVLSNNETRILSNYSNLDENYKPIIKITNRGSSSDIIKITNNTFSKNSLELSRIESGETIIVDCKMCTALNLNNENRFDVFNNYNFIELLRNSNEINVVGNATVEFICEFPITF